MYCAICIFSVISQVLLIVAFVKDPLKCFRNSGTYLVANLAVSDFLTCFLAPFLCCIPTKWYWSVECAMWNSAVLSMLTITSISIDRFLLVVYPLKHRVLMKGKVIVVWLLFIWCVGCILQIKGSLFFTRMDSTILNFAHIALIIFTSVIYGFTCSKLKSQSKNLALENIPHRHQKARVIKEKRFLTTIILISCIALICIVPPSIIYYLLRHHHLFHHDLTSSIVRGTSKLTFLLNFSVNPLVYVVRLPNYRKTFCLLYLRKGTSL